MLNTLSNERLLMVENASNVVGITTFAKTSFFVYPNPSVKGEMNLHLTEGGAYQIRLQDMLGSLVLEQIVSGDDVLDVTNLSDGVYTLVVTSNGKSWMEKVIVRNKE
jgi:hypothetical protein